LGAGRFADREEAARALAELGREGLPALRAAKKSQDPEIRSRAEALLDRIETDLLIRPTLVTLDFADQPVADVFATLSQRTGMTLVTLPENNPVWKTRRMTLTAPEPVPFWAMVDRLTRAAKLQDSTNVRSIPGKSGAVMQFFDGDSTATNP